MRPSVQASYLLRRKAFAFAVPSRVRRLGLTLTLILTLTLTLTPTKVEEQCNDPKLMHCGLEKCVAADGSVEWVAAHSKARPNASCACFPRPHRSCPSPPPCRPLPLHPQERFQLEGAKCLIWNQHSLEASSD